jgi:nitrogenase subunit NifH
MRSQKLIKLYKCEEIYRKGKSQLVSIYYLKNWKKFQKKYNYDIYDLLSIMIHRAYDKGDYFELYLGNKLYNSILNYTKEHIEEFTYIINIEQFFEMHNIVLKFLKTGEERLEIFDNTKEIK